MQALTLPKWPRPKTLIEAFNNDIACLERAIVALKKGEGLAITQNGQVVKFKFDIDQGRISNLR